MTVYENCRWRVDRQFAISTRISSARSSCSRVSRSGAATRAPCRRRAADAGIAAADEPANCVARRTLAGLAPLIVKLIFNAISNSIARRVCRVPVEQNAFHALKLAHRGYVMVNGLITMSARPELLARPEVRAAYLEGAIDERLI